jgi:hypothetical protein
LAGPIRDIDPQVVVNLFPELAVGLDLVRHGNWPGEGLPSLLSTKSIPDRDFHSFAGEHRVREPFSTQFFDALKKLVVVFGVVMREGQALHAGHFRNLHGLIEAAVSPSAPFLQFLGRVLRVMD